MNCRNVRADCVRTPSAVGSPGLIISAGLEIRKARDAVPLRIRALVRAARMGLASYPDSAAITFSSRADLLGGQYMASADR
jgi:hypothetical protein